jgi:hypothetical protein
MNKLIKIISIISLISVFTLTGCNKQISENVTEGDSGNMTINLEEGYKFVDIKIGLDTRKSNIENVYVYTLTKKRDTSEKPETYKMDMMYSHGPGTHSMPKHITIIEN